MPEQADNEGEEAKAADLDALLELFREPEEPPRKKIPGTVWMFLALVLAMVAVWLAARVATGQMVAKSHAVAMRPAKAGDREPRSREGFTGSVGDDYVARCKKGLTAREVRWIVEDFRKEGLDAGPGSLLQQIRDIVSAAYGPSKKGIPPALGPEQKARLLNLLKRSAERQRSWYADALDSGLDLDRQQWLQVSERLRQLADEDQARFSAEWSRRESESQVQGALPPDGMWIQGFFGNALFSSNWLAQDTYAPWELCSLTPDQEAVTRRSEVDGEEVEKSGEGEEDLPWTATWPDHATPYRAGVATTADLQGKDGDFGPLSAAGSVFPLERVQLPKDGGAVVWMDDPTRLHPAQLKILLLLEPEQAGRILEALEQAGQ